jgi:hypothetical protein
VVRETAPAENLSPSPTRMPTLTTRASPPNAHPPPRALADATRAAYQPRAPARPNIFPNARTARPLWEPRDARDRRRMVSFRNAQKKRVLFTIATETREEDHPSRRRLSSLD